MRAFLPSRVANQFGNALLATMCGLLGISAGLVLVTMGHLVGAAVAFPIGVAFVAMASKATVVEVGDDGVLVRWLGRPRFVGYAAIAEVRQHVAYKVQSGFHEGPVEKSRGVLLVMRDGATEYLVCDDEAGVTMLGEAIVERLRRHRGGAPVEVPGLGREGRSLPAWIEALTGMFRARTYREAPPHPAVLWTVVESPGAPAETRAAAALALKAHLGDEATPRLRVAIDGCVEPQLRVALEAVEAGQAEEALAAVTKR